jgi:hypothetical protein
MTSSFHLFLTRRTIVPRSSLVVVLSACSLSAGAAPILTTNGYVSFRKLSEPGNLQLFCSASGGASVACAGSGPLRDLPDMTLSFDTWAQAAPGVLKARSAASLNGTGVETENSISIIRADATFRDRITFFGLSAGTQGAVVFSFVLSGSVSGTNLVHLNSGVPFQDTNSAAVGVIGKWYVGGVAHSDPVLPSYGPGVQNIVIPVTFETPLDVSFTLQALLNMRVFADGENATSDFASTAVLAGMSAYDLNGRLVEGFYATGSGDSSYLDVGPAIPEPATWLSAVFGLLFLKSLSASARRRMVRTKQGERPLESVH